MSGQDTTAVSGLLDLVAAAFGLGAVRAAGALGGTASPKWRVETAQGQFVVRRRPPEFAAAATVRFHHALLTRLAAAGLPVPRPLAQPDGSTAFSYEGHVYEVLAWVEGMPLVEGDMGAIGGLGTFLARFHQVPAHDVPADQEGRLREDHPELLAPYLADLRSRTADPESIRQLDALGGQLQLVRERLDAGLYASLPQGVIHGDVHPGNFRFRGPEVSAVYDFDYLSLQARVRDVTDALMFFAARRETPLEADRIESLTQPFTLDPARCGQLLRAYQRGRRLADHEWQAMPWLVRSRWLQMRLRGSRKVPPERKVPFVLHRLFEVVDWLDRHGDAFFPRLRDSTT